MNPKDAAVAAAERWAFYVFPIPPLRKAAKGWPGWPHRNSNDPAFLASHWPSPRHNYGIACKRSGLVALDLDVSGQDDLSRHHGVPEGARILAQRCAEHGQQWPETLTLGTPRGGWHLVFRAIPGHPIGNGGGRNLGPHIDVRGGGASGGGYIVGPGSVVGEHAYDKPVTLINGGRYVVTADLPVMPLLPWLAALLASPPPAAAAGPVGCDVAGYALAALRGETERVLKARRDRNETLNRAAFALGQLTGAGLLPEHLVVGALTTAAEAAGLHTDHNCGPRGIAATIQSGLRSGARHPRTPRPAA